MTEHHTGSRPTHPLRIVAWAAATLLLLLPLIAMQFTDEVQWTAFDFIFAGALIYGTGFVLELAVRTTRNTAYRVAVGIALTATFLIIWISGAVGIIGSEGNLANMMYFVALLVGIFGVILARLRAQGMARAMFAVAAALGLIVGVVLVTRWGSESVIWPWEVVLLNGFFAALYTASGVLFQEAARRSSAAGTEPRS